MSVAASLSQETLKHRLNDIPDKFKPHIRMGFHLLSRCSSEERKDFLGYILDITEKGDSLDREKAVKLTGLDLNTISDALSAVAMTIGSTVDTDISTEDFVLFGKDVAFDSSDEAAVREIVDNIILRRTTLKSGMKDSALANSVLPSFQGLSYEVDLRLRFESGKESPTGGVPIAVCNLKTDCTDDLWFQMTVNDVDEVIERLQKLSKQLRFAQTLSGSIL